MSNKKPHITYLFGAGASWQSMPVVAELNDDLRSLDYDYEDGPSFSIPRYPPTRIPREESFDPPEAHWFVRPQDVVHEVMHQIDAFETVDTLAKFWTVTNPERLPYLKRAINMYFALRHFAPYIAISKQRTRWDEQSMSKVSKRKLRFDPRYDSLIAGLFSVKDGSHDKRVNYLSYNYDLELEQALIKFGLNRPNGSGGDVEVYHINGHCTNLWGEAKTTEEEVTNRILASAPSIGYAWENLGESLDEVKKFLSLTTHLVVIGYSFPVFNREIDRQILEAPNLKKIYLQDLPSALPGIENRVKALLAERAEFTPALFENIGGSKRETTPQIGVEIETIDSVDQFHIPFELI